METDRYIIDESGILVVKPGVTSIANKEFLDFDKIKKAVLPRTVRWIESYAFGHCKSLQSINIPPGIRRIDHLTFAGCASLTRIDLPEGLTEICERAFSDCSKLKTVNMPSTLVKIGRLAFSNCESLKQIVVPSSTEFDHTAFYECDALERVSIRDIEPRVSKTEVKKLVLIEHPQYHRSGMLYGAVIGVEPGEETVEYARLVLKQLLWDSFKCSGLYLDYEDYSFRDMPPVNVVLEYDKQRFAIIDLPQGTSPSTIQVGTNTYLTDEAFFKSLVEGSVIEWMPLVEKGK